MTTETTKLYENIKITNLEDSEIEIKGEIPVSTHAPYRTKVLKKLGKNANIDGFRKGHIPEKILIGKIGEDSLMSEIAEMALADIYPTLVRDKNLEVIGAPQVTITKLAQGNPIGFKIKSAVLPKFNLPNYTEIVKNAMKEVSDTEHDLAVTDADVERVLTEVRRGKARFEKSQKQMQEKTKGQSEETNTKEALETPQKVNVSEVKEEDLPELDDTFISTLGDFKTVDDFKVRVREDLKKEKVQKIHEKKRITLSEELIKKTDITVPKILVTSELNKMVAQMKDDVTRMQMTFEDYLARTKKTEEDLRTEWREQAEKRATLQLLLNKIAIKENITANHDEVHKQIKHILEHHKDANPQNVHIYVETQLTNEAVFEFLEGGSKESVKETNGKTVEK